MPDAFFSKSRKRKRAASTEKHRHSFSAHKKQRKDPTQVISKANGIVAKRKVRVDEELSDKTDNDEGGIEDVDLQPDAAVDEAASGPEDDDETPAEKRLRLAQLYLDSVKESLVDGEFDARDIDKELISARLKQNVTEHSGKVHRFIADSFDFSQPPKTILRTRGHKLPVTSAVACETGKYMFTSGKEGSIIKWDLASGKRLSSFYKTRPPKSSGKGKEKATEETKGHTDEVLALALSSDGQYLASAGKDRRICLWDAEKGEWLKGFEGKLCHRDTISALAFRKGTHQLYTASFDRTVKVYDMSPSVLGYVETLFGHQDQILGIDALRGEACVTVGGRDKTVRLWKIVEETQLVFRGGGRSRVREVLEGGLRGDENEDKVESDYKEKDHQTKFVEGSLECVAMIDEVTFVSGGDSGSISLWITTKKKPIFTQSLAHGLNEVVSETEGVIRTPRWVTAIASLRYSDMFVSGSWGGDVRIWKLDSKLKSFSLIGSLPASGVINSLQLVSPPDEFFKSSSWITVHQPSHGQNQNAPLRKGTASCILLIVAVGREHRLGRWLTIKEGVSNGTIVVALTPRTLA